ncbi:MAG TPA: copper resistance protein NlpE [Edaphobacter sp.]
MRFLFGVVLMFCLAASLEAKTVTLGSADDRTAVSLNLGDTLVVELPSTLPGQYRWVSHIEKGGALTSQGDSEIAADSRKEAAQQFRYNAARVGQAVLRLAFETEKKQASGVPVTSRFSVRVQVASGTPSADAGVLIGSYKGMLPCADCEGLDTELKLYAKGRFDTSNAVYIETRTYRGSRDGDVAYTDRGLWTMLKGSATDPKATVYQLNPDKAEERQSYLLKDNGAALEQLDRELNPIETKMNLTLRKVR